MTQTGYDLQNAFGREILHNTQMSSGILSGITDLYLSGHTSNPGDGGPQTASEATYTSYARTAIPRDSSTGWNFTDLSSQGDNKNIIELPQCSGVSDDQTLTWWGIGTAASGAGILLGYCPIGTTTAGWMWGICDAAADTITVASAHLVDQSLAAGNELAVLPLYGQTSTMGGLSGSTRYAIRNGTVSGTYPGLITFQLTTTLDGSGSAVNLTGNHGVMLYRTTALRVQNGVRPTINASALKWLFS